MVNKMLNFKTFKYKFSNETITIKSSLYFVLLFIFWTIVAFVAGIYTYIKFLGRGENKDALITISIISITISLLLTGIVIGRLLFKLSFSKNGIEICSWKGRMVITYNDLRQWGVIKNCGGFVFWERDTQYYEENTVYFSKNQVDPQKLYNKLNFKITILIN